MNKLNVTVTYLDGTVKDVRVLPVTEVAFEREFKTGLATFANDPRNEYMYWLAWHAGRNGKGFDEWLGTVESIDLEVEEVTPTEPAPPAT